MATFLMTLFIIVCVLLIVVVLLQKGRGGGLGAAFGGLGSSAFGTRVGDVFTWVTIVLTATFLLLAIGTSMYFHPEAGVVEKPYFNPPDNRKYTEDVGVRIFCDTDDTEIYYTTNGETPTEKDDLFTGIPVPLRIIDEDVTLKARAFRVAWEPSEVAVGIYGPNWKPASQPAGLPPDSQPSDAEKAPAPVPSD